jgi:required for meiotic nuclear division protein 1
MSQIKIEAYQVAEAFNIKKLRADFRAEALVGNNSELFYVLEDYDRFLYIFDYGVIVFGNYDEISKSELLRFVKIYSENWVESDEINEQYWLETDEKISKPIVKNDRVFVQESTPSVVRIVMLNVGQSVALEFYERLTEQMLSDTRIYTLNLEQKGKLSVSKTKLLMFIGRVLNVKNSIIDNLYILDDPNSVWDSPELDNLNRNLKTNFDTNARFKDLDYRLQIVENNLRLFTEVLNHRESHYLEWIVIILISIEIVNTLFFHR